ncbi:V8-like Glu-specific endopeptidase [Spinactinospora alkalitolerans]|uniref:V8-like Glu-specific endopeptidase n=1 Tax=Spinactinospora alkalitolerans TaxID=687207 RepID=A0A852TR88_9ACTN|nr:trypsin-like serine protease [Spinactinospora alkalitolerans]NYE46075.1 V8-like Glu-specific endopeptidase [Spinactinospora alkalitolerans]
MTPSVAHKVLGPLAGIAIAMAGVPADGGGADRPAATATRAHEGVVRQSAADGPGERRDVLAYWTAERMAAAEPIGPSLDEAPDARPLTAAQEADSPASPGHGGTEHQAAPRSGSTGKRWTGGGKVTRTTGRVFLTMNGRDFTCSASVIPAENKDTVITAGHCLKDGTGPWARNWVFVPGYDDGDRPYGDYTAREMLVAPQWGREADDSFDFGMAVLDTGSGGAHVAERTGHQEIAFGTGHSDRVYSFGYPSVDRYDGRHLHYCSGPVRPDRGGTSASGMACRMSEGSSGGPWLSGFDPRTGTGTITSVISFKYADNPGRQYGPRLGSAAERVYDTAQAL